MSSLIDRQIRSWAKMGGLKPFDPELVNPASINLRVGPTAKIETPNGIEDLDLSRYSDSFPYWVPPQGWILTDVMERIRIDPDMEALVVLRSSAARRGWDHALAGYVDPGYGYNTPDGSVLTLEFVNCLRYHHLPIYPGLQLVQLRISMLQTVPTQHYGHTGRYNGAQKVEGCKDLNLQ